MVKAFFGDQAIPYALLYDQLGSFIALAIYGSIILAYYGTEKENITWINIAKKVISFPPFIALVLALVFKDSAYPFVVENLLEMLAATLIP
jgi:predicted permease